MGFEPTLAFRLSLISSQVPSTAQPPFQCEGEEDSEKVRVVEGKGGSEWGIRRNGERACVAELSTDQPIKSIFQHSTTPALQTDRGLRRGRERRESQTANRQPSTLNAKRRTLIDLFPFGISFALAEELVVVGELVHQHPEKADHIWPHGVEPLSRFDEEETGAHETAGGDDTDTGIHPSDDRAGI